MTHAAPAGLLPIAPQHLSQFGGGALLSLHAESRYPAAARPGLSTSTHPRHHNGTPARSKPPLRCSHWLPGWQGRGSRVLSFLAARRPPLPFHDAQRLLYFLPSQARPPPPSPDSRDQQAITGKDRIRCVRTQYRGMTTSSSGAAGRMTAEKGQRASGA